MARRLIIRFAPNMAEPLSAYLLRLAEFNGYRGLRSILSIAHLPPSFATKPCDFSELAYLCGCEPGHFEQLAYWSGCSGPSVFRMGTSEISRRLVSISKSRFCSICLQRGEHYQDIWDVFGYVCCPQHNCFLTDRCRSCGQLTNWRRPAISCCPCGVEFTEENVRPAFGLIKVAQSFKSLRDGQASLDGAAPVTTFNAGVSLLKFLVTWRSEIHSWRRSGILDADVAGSVDAIESAASAFLDWPDGLRRWMTRARRNGHFQIDFSEAAGRLVNRLRLALPDQGAETVLEEVSQWAVHRVWGSASRRPKSP